MNGMPLRAGWIWQPNEKLVTHRVTRGSQGLDPGGRDLLLVFGVILRLVTSKRQRATTAVRLLFLVCHGFAMVDCYTLT